jgi:cholesterol oxidase
MADVQHFDAVIVGSGFGGSVAAFRLAADRQRVLVLERGKAYPPGSFARTPREMHANFWDPSEGLHGMFDLWSFRGLEAVVSSGLGGGSLIYANVLLRKDERWFVVKDPVRGGYETWPITRADLEPHYDEVEAMLGAQRFPFGESGYEAVAKTGAMQGAARDLGHEWQLPPLAVSFSPSPGERAVPGEAIREADYPNIHGRSRQTCRLCGECDVGCNYGSKNTLDHTYLSAAAHHGAEIRTRCEVRSFAPRSGGGYNVGFVTHAAEREGKKTNTGKLPVTKVTCDRLILAAGTLGSPYLLLRNRSAYPGISRTLGTRFCGNGDLLSFALKATERNGGAGRVLNPSRGPVITSAIRVPDAVDGGRGRGFYIQDAGYPGFVDWMLETTTVGSTAVRVARFALRRLWARLSRDPKSMLGAEISQLIGNTHLSSGSLPLLGMGRDIPDGVMSLSKGYLAIDWTTKTSQKYFDRVTSTMADIAHAMGARFEQNPLSHLKRVVTVHPLGGCPMGDTDKEGVVDAYGQVFGYPDLYVLDGSVMPGPVGANPSLTIAAFADRAVCHMIESRPHDRKGRVRT